MLARSLNLRLQSFPPLQGHDARLLILGSLPGAASLQAHQYYAHPRNAFWSIVQALFNIERAQPYDARMHALQNRGVAVWDVLASCRRRTSLDAHIEPDSVVANDLREFLDGHPGIRHIYFNGAAAGRLFERHVLTTLTTCQQQLPRLVLPSTSPAHAGRSLQQKIEAWEVIRRAARWLATARAAHPVPLPQADSFPAARRDRRAATRTWRRHRRGWSPPCARARARAPRARRPRH